jgi:hypothetical protein
MKKLLIGTALAGALVGTFASLSLAAPLPAQLDPHNSASIVSVDYRCGPYRHFMHGFHDRYGHWIPGRCLRNR